MKATQTTLHCDRSISLIAHYFVLSRESLQSVVLVYEHGEGLQTKGVIVDKGLEFTIGEMSSVDLGPLANNRLFRGGEVRPLRVLTCASFGDSARALHKA